MGANGSSVYDIITNGYNRTVTEIGNSIYVAVPSEFAEEHDIKQGDKVAIQELDGEEIALGVHFGNDE